MSVKPKSHLKGLLLAGSALVLAGGLAGQALLPGPVFAEIPQAESLVGPDGSFAQIVRQDKPAIVTITTRMKAPQQQGMGGPNMPPEEFFRRFFGPGFPGLPNGPQQPAPEGRALGSGFIIDPAGIIVTNNHVIANATEITVTLDDGRDFKGTLVGADPKTDIAVVKIDVGENLPAVQWGDSDRMEVGDKIIAIGNPFGVGTSVTAGIVSARGRDLNNGPYDDFLQIDAPINHGNSGGAVIAEDGKVVGISTAILSPDGNSVGLGFAIPSDMAQQVVASLVKNGTVERGWLGVRIQPVGPDVADALGLPNAKGALVAEVTPGTPAAAAGLKAGDVVLAVGDHEVTDARSLSRTIAAIAPGHAAELKVWRDGKELTLKATLGTMPNDNVAQQGTTPQAAPEAQLGLTVQSITPDMREQLGLGSISGGVVVTAVDPDSAAADRGLAAGDVVLQAANEPLSKPSDLSAAVSAAKAEGKSAVLLLVLHQGQQLFVALPLSQS